LTGLSQNEGMIEVTRAIQGLTAAFMSPAALSIVLTTFKQGKERTKALSVWGAVAAGGAAAGVLFGGILTQYLDWRWNFFVNVPVGLAVAIAAWAYVPESKADLNHRKLDVPGAVLVTSGLMLLVYAFTKAPGYGWLDHRTLELIGGSVLLLVLFLWNEHKSSHALMPLKFFTVANVGSANLTIMPVIAGMFSMFFFVTLYVQQVLQYSPVRTGLGFLPITLIIGVISVNMQHLLPRVGYKKPLVVAPLLMAGGLFWLAHMHVDGTYWTDVFPGLMLVAAGMGMVFVSITIAATNGVSGKDSGLASGLLNTAQQVGGSLGLAILSGVSASAAVSYFHAHAAQASQPLTRLQAEVAGFHHALYVGMCFALVASVLAFFLIHEHKGEKISTDPADLIAG
jgi:MFS family permease